MTTVKGREAEGLEWPDKPGIWWRADENRITRVYFSDDGRTFYPLHGPGVALHEVPRNGWRTNPLWQPTPDALPAAMQDGETARVRELEAERDRLRSRLNSVTCPLPNRQDLLDAHAEIAALREQNEKLRGAMQRVVGGNGTLDMRPSMLGAAKFCSDFALEQPHADGVANCAHCNLKYAASSIERLIAGINAALAQKE